MKTETTNSAACIYGELDREVANGNKNNIAGLNATKRAVFADQNLIQSTDGLCASQTNSIVVDVKSALTQEKSDEYASYEESLIVVENGKDVIRLDQSPDKVEQSELSMTVKATDTSNLA